MGTWGIARDMAKRNEENLSLLNEKSIYSKLKGWRSSSSNRVYTYKKSTPELLASIREHQQAANRRLRTKRLIFLGLTTIGLFATVYFLVTI